MFLDKFNEETRNFVELMNFEKTGYGMFMDNHNRATETKEACRFLLTNLETIVSCLRGAGTRSRKSEGRTAEPELARRYVIVNFSSKDVQGKAAFPKGLWTKRSCAAMPVPVAVLFHDSFSVHSKLMRRHQICGVREMG